MELSHCTAEEALRKLVAESLPHANRERTVNASLLKSLDVALLTALAQVNDLDVSHSDLSTGTLAEENAQAAVDQMVLHRTDLQRAQGDYNNAHKEKEFSKIQEIKKSATERKEKNTAAISTLEFRLEKLEKSMSKASWRLLEQMWKTAGRCPARLALKNCGLSTYALAQLRPVIAGHVEELLLDGNDLGDRGIEEVGELLAESKLRRLTVRNCGLTDAGMGVLAAGLMRSATLETLDARDNGLASRGAALAFDAIQQYRSVECLL